MPIDPRSFRALTFDCYGTLMDWESGILASMRPVLRSHGLPRSDQEILAAYARLEAEVEAGPYMPYREVLRSVAGAMAKEWGFDAGPGDRDALLEGFAGWEPFPDTVNALRALHGRYRLGIISNVDDDLFKLTARKLEISFDWVTTAGQAGAYKPATGIFLKALDRMGIERERVLHVAQSVYHDVSPAGELGLATVWIRRRSRAGSYGVSPEASGRPDAEVTDMQGLVTLLGLD